MSDYPQGQAAILDSSPVGTLSTFGKESQCGGYNMLSRNGQAGAVWPSINMALFYPITVDNDCTVFHMSTEVTTTAAGNIDVGIYDEGLVKVVSSGSTAIAAAGLQTFNVTDTVLVPGVYYLAMSCSTVTTAAFRRVAANASTLRCTGAFQMATAIPLPATATVASMAQAYMPTINAHVFNVTP